jgi:O-antigen/teichoic acid export membrane protein
VFKHSAIYLLSTLLNKAVPLLLLPILTRLLTPVEYGTIVMLQVFLFFFQSLLGGLNVNISRNYFSMGRYRFASYMTAVFVVLMILFLGSTILSLLYLATDLPLFGLSRNWFLAMPILSCASMANMLNLTMMRTEGRAKSYGAWEISNGIMGLVLTLALLLVFELGWTARAYGLVVPMLIYGGLGSVALYRQGKLPLRFRWLDVRATLLVTIVLIPHSLSGFIVSFVDRIFLKEMVGVDQVGIYTIGYQFGTLTMLITTAFLKAWQPWFYEKIASGSVSDRAEIAKNTWIYLGVLLLGSILYLFMAYFLLPYFVDERYWEARTVLLPLVLASVAYGGYQIFFPYLVHLKLTNVLSTATPIAAVINVALNFILVPKFGMMGAAYATLAAYMSTFFYVATVSCRRTSLPWFSWKQ